MKNCGQTVHDEVANKQTMEELKELLKVSGHMTGGHSQGARWARPQPGAHSGWGAQWAGDIWLRGSGMCLYSARSPGTASCKLS